LLDPPRAGKKEANWGIITRFVNLKKFAKGTPFEIYDKSDSKHFKQVRGDVEYGNKDMPGGIGEVKDIQRVLRPEEPGRRAGRPVHRRPTRGNAPDKVETETVLIDPMTREEMSKTFDFITQEEIDSDPALDADDLGRIKIDKLNGEPKYIVRDHWFRINVKFLWNESPDAQKKDEGSN
jgi:hypothetical protein